MSEKFKIYFFPIEEPRMDCVCKAVQKGLKFLDGLYNKYKDVKDVSLYVWSKQDIPYYFKESFTPEAIKILTDGKTLVGVNLKIKLESHETFSTSSNVETILTAHPNKKMFDDISASIAKGTVKTVVIINDEKKSEPWLTTWAPNLEKIE